MQRYFRQVAALGALALSVGCSPPELSTENLPRCEYDAACTQDTDCASAYVPDLVGGCVEGRCYGRFECETDADCEAGDRCVESVDGHALYHRDCVADFVCASDADCASGRCYAGLCRGVGCGETGCPEGERCGENGACFTPECSTSDDCAEHEECRGERCVAAGCAMECPEGQGCARLNGVYGCRTRCSDDCECLGYSLSEASVCVDGFCVRTECYDGLDWGCGLGAAVTCVNARPLGRCPPR